MTTSPRQNRVMALDTLRGLAILAMILSGQLPFDQNALPAWMYHAQVPPPAFKFNGDLPGISWVDLVFPFFLFSMGAAFPLALHRRMQAGASVRKTVLIVLERSLLLGFFALFVQLIRPYTLSESPGTAVWCQALLGFVILFPILTRLPESWPRQARLAIRALGWLAALGFCLFTTYPDGTGFSLHRSDIIIIVLSNMAFFGAVAWIVTRNNLVLRLGVLGILFAIRMSNLPTATPGWVHELWIWSPAPWIYRLYYLQYLFIVIPGTIAGDLMLQWSKSAPGTASEERHSSVFYAAAVLLMTGILLIALFGLKARWLASTTLAIFSLCAAGLWLLAKPRNETERFYKTLFQWAVYWLVLGLFFEPYEGGIKKDHPTLSYYFVTSGLAICVFIAISVVMDIFKKDRWFALLVNNGQNPMLAYAAINNFTIPILALTGGAAVLTHWATSPLLGFCKALIVTMITAVCVALLTRRKIFWRT